MININNFSISNDGTELNVSVQTDIGHNITSAIVWTEDTFKNYSLAVDVSSFLTQNTHLETFSIPASTIGVSSLQGIYFIEFETTSEETEGECTNCSNSLGVAASLNSYKECLLSKVLNYSVCNDFSTCGDDKLCNILNINTLIKGLQISLEFGYYGEAIDLLKALKKLCKYEDGCLDCGGCSECADLPTPNFKSGLDYGTLNGSLILI